MGSVMNQTKTSSRIVLFTGPASTTKKTVCRKPPKPPKHLSASSRIALIKYGQLVNGKAG
jgi:hypothetical protein